MGTKKGQTRKTARKAYEGKGPRPQNNYTPTVSPKMGRNKVRIFGFKDRISGIKGWFPDLKSMKIGRKK